MQQSTTAENIILDYAESTQTDSNKDASTLILLKEDNIIIIYQLVVE